MKVNKWMDAVMRGVDAHKMPTVEEVKLAWYLKQNMVTKRILKKYVLK